MSNAELLRTMLAETVHGPEPRRVGASSASFPHMELKGAALGHSGAQQMHSEETGQKLLTQPDAKDGTPR